MGYSKKFLKKIELWQSRLVDLSRRNKQLYLNLQAKNTVEILSPHLEGLFEQLVINHRKLKFVSVYESEEINEIEQQLAIDRNIGTLKHGELVTNKEDQNLSKYLSIFSRRAKSDSEERGINVLYIAFGLVEWYENKKQKEANYSPLLFIPVQLIRKNIYEKFHVKAIDDEIILNNLIEKKFMDDFKLKLPELPEYLDPRQLEYYFIQLDELFARNKNWRLHRRSFIGLFSFSSIRLYKDMAEHRKQLYNHKIIRSIAEGQTYLEENIPTEEQYGDSVHPSLKYSVLDNDSSQEKAIRYALNGCSMIIKGPPGTGKSQTITNIIAEYLSMGKTILFVAQKMAALSVVKSRLDTLGLGNFCLDLHSHDSKKRGVLEQIKASLGTSFDPPHLDSAFYDRLGLTRDELNSYVERINESNGSIEKSLFNLIGEYYRLEHIPDIKARILGIEDYSNDDLFEIEKNLTLLNKFRTYLFAFKNYANNWSGVEVINYNFNADHILDEINALNSYQLSISKSYRLMRHNLEKELRIEDTILYNAQFTEVDLSVFDLDLDRLLNKFQGSYKSFFRHFSRKYHRDRNMLFENLNVLGDEQIRNKLAIMCELKYDLIREDTDLSVFMELNNKIADTLKITKGIITKLNRELDFQLHLDDTLELTDFSEQFQPLFDLAQSDENLREWQQINYLIDFVEKKVGVDFLDKLKKMRKRAPIEQIFKRKYYQILISKYLELQDLNRFDPILQDKLVSDFKKMDANSLKFNQIRLLSLLFSRRTESMDNKFLSSIESSEISLLEKELVKKNRIKPLRKIITQSKNYLVKLKPCFLMSPLSIANYLPGHEFDEFFDLVIFDEASQIPPHEAVGSILRAKQTIIVGDDKQMPPTSFFSSISDYDDDEGELHAYESILDEFSGIGLPETVLNWHYRSKKEKLIAFSNFHYYDNQLNTFPDILRSGDLGKSDIKLMPALEFRHVGGIYDRGQSRKNIIESRHVVDAVIKHFRWNEETGNNFSLGIIAFSNAQADSIRNELERVMRADSKIMALLSRQEQGREPLFIKNLENVQGDERDFIFFSIGYGVDKEGRMTKNFGPLNRDGGERRLNVAITRARYHNKIFCSFDPELMDYSTVKSTGFIHLMSYLKFAKSGNGTHFDRGVQLDAGIDHPFEEDVVKSLEEMGYQVDLRVGTAGYRIDIAVVHPNNPSLYILAIECDSSSYQGSKTARDRERIRHDVLKQLGWYTHHIWSINWYQNKDEELGKIRELIEELAKGIIREKTPGEEEFQIGTLLSNKVWEVEKTSKTQKRSIEYRQRYLGIPGIHEYEQYTDAGIFSPEEIYDSEIFETVKNKIVAVEGPIHKELLIRRILPVFKIPKLNRKIKEYLDLELFESFYTTGNGQGQIRIALDTKQDPRKYEHIDDEELKLAITLIIREIKSCREEELRREVMNLFGFKVINDKMETKFSLLLNQLEEDYVLEAVDGMVEVNKYF